MRFHPFLANFICWLRALIRETPSLANQQKNALRLGADMGMHQNVLGCLYRELWLAFHMRLHTVSVFRNVFHPVECMWVDGRLVDHGLVGNRYMYSEGREKVLEGFRDVECRLVYHGLVRSDPNELNICLDSNRRHAWLCNCHVVDTDNCHVA